MGVGNVLTEQGNGVKEYPMQFLIRLSRGPCEIRRVEFGLRRLKEGIGRPFRGPRIRLLYFGFGSGRWWLLSMVCREVNNNAATDNNDAGQRKERSLASACPPLEEVSTLLSTRPEWCLSPQVGRQRPGHTTDI